MADVEGILLPWIEDIDVEDLLTLPEGYRYELHDGNLVIRTPATLRGIPEYWIVDRAPDQARDDAVVHLYRLAQSGAYVRERTVLLFELEAECRAKGGDLVRPSTGQ